MPYERVCCELRRDDPDGSAAPLRVVLVAHAALSREFLRTVIARHPELEVVGVCESIAEVEAALAAAVPDVIVADVRMPPDDGTVIELVARARRQRPGLGVVVVADEADRADLLALVGPGTSHSAYLLRKNLPGTDKLAAAITAVASGEVLIDPAAVTGMLISPPSHRRPRTPAS